MFKINELSGHLIKSGRFKEAIPKFYDELKECVANGVISFRETTQLSEAFAHILLNPSDILEVNSLGDKMITLVLRIPGKIPTVTEEEFEANVKASREAD